MNFILSAIAFIITTSFYIWGLIYAFTQMGFFWGIATLFIPIIPVIHLLIGWFS